MIPATVVVVGTLYPLGPATFAATTALCGLLVVAAAFAFLRYRDLNEATRLVERYRGTFLALRRVILVILAAVFVAGVVYVAMAGSSDWPLALLLYALAVAEYVNYFHVQLMYDNASDLAYVRQHRRLKRGLIARYVGDERGR